MPESELTEDAIRVLKKADKLVRDIKKDTANLLEALRQLKKDSGSSEDADE